MSRTVPARPGFLVIREGIALVAKRIEHVPHSDPPLSVLKPVNPEYGNHEQPSGEVHVVRRPGLFRKLEEGGLVTPSPTAV